MAAQTGLLIRYQALVFDLSGMHSADLLTRVRAALLGGLDRAQSSPRLQTLLTTLTALSSRNPVRFFTNATEWLPGSAAPSYPAVTTWSVMSARQPASMAELLALRSDVRIFMQDLGDTFAGTLETTWHELLHPTVPFTHPQEGLPPDVVVDYPKWIAAMRQIKAEMPLSVTDPVTGAVQSTQYEWSMRDTQRLCCSRLA